MVKPFNLNKMGWFGLPPYKMKYAKSEHYHTQVVNISNGWQHLKRKHKPMFPK